jgi:hypothetical protein
MEKIDVFLIFTDGEFSHDHVQFAEEMKSKSKPIFFVRTKIYDKSKDLESKEKTKLEEIRSSLSKNLKDLGYDEGQIYLISNDHPDKSEFGELRNAIANSLPHPQEESFTNLPDIQHLIALERFQEFMKGTAQ